MTTTQTDEIKTWQQRLEETCPAIGPMHIHACVEEVNDAMQAEIDDLRAALQEQAPKRLWGMAGFNPPLPNVGEKYTSIHEDDLGDHVTVTGIANASSPNIAYVFLSWDDGHYGERAIDEFWQEYMLVQTNEQAREGEAVAIKDAVGCVLEGWTLPEPVRKILETAYYAAPQPAQPEYFAQYEYAPDFSVLVAVYRRRADQVPELIHKEALPKQIGDGQPAQPEQGERQTPFSNCRFRICDLPGQCKGEGRCHHPAVPAFQQSAQPEQGERSASKAELLKNLTQWLDGLGLEIHTYSLRGIALHGFEKGWDAALQSAQPVALPMADVAKNATLEAELATLHANGAKAWAGVDPQELRTGMTPLSQPDKQRLWNDARHNNPQAIEDAAMEYGALVEAAHGIGGAL